MQQVSQGVRQIIARVQLKSGKQFFERAVVCDFTDVIRPLSPTSFRYFKYQLVSFILELISSNFLQSKDVLVLLP